MWQFARAVEGIGAACRALDIPITGGNVSLYNETDGRAVLPTPVLGVVGLLEHAGRVVKRGFRSAGDVIVLLGEGFGELGGSEYLKIVHGVVRGVPPVLDLERERRLQALLVQAAEAGLIRSAHDCAEGGLAVALAECCFDTSHGAEVNVPGVVLPEPVFSDIATLFGESASRAVVSATPERTDELLAEASAAGVPAEIIGRVGGDRIRIAVDRRTVIDTPLSDAERVWSTTIDQYFEPAKGSAPAIPAEPLPG
jgi:phosphoribosylformylglycinamidine synthase